MSYYLFDLNKNFSFVTIILSFFLPIIILSIR